MLDCPDLPPFPILPVFAQGFQLTHAASAITFGMPAVGGADPRCTGRPGKRETCARVAGRAIMYVIPNA